MSKIEVENSISWTRTYEVMKSKHDETFALIDEGVRLDKDLRPREALDRYKAAIIIIDGILAIPVECPDNPDSTWKEACDMIQKLKRTRAEVLLRITRIHEATDWISEPPEEDPPSYDEVMASSASEDEAPRTYQELATSLKGLSLELQQMEEELIYSHDNVRVYFISPNGEVLSTMEPETLKIIAYTRSNVPIKAVLYVGSFLYPLVPGVSPCYRTNYGAFILPDLSSSVPGSSVGIILPSDADKDVFDMLENILYGIVREGSTETIGQHMPYEIEPPEDYSTNVSNRIVDGALFISQNLIRGAMKASELLNKTTPKLINGISGAQSPAEIPSGLSQTMKIAEKTTNTAATVTGFVAEKVGHATMKLGQFLAPHVQKQGTKLLTTGFNMSEEEASNKMKNILTVTAGAVEGFSTVYAGLETSAVILGKNLKDNTVKIVQHRYGQPASTLTDDTLSTVGNVYTIAHHSKVLTPKGLAKRGVKDAGKAVVHSYSASCRASTSYQKRLNEGKSKDSEKMEANDDEESDNENVNKKG